jgi:hypothetical protein
MNEMNRGFRQRLLDAEHVTPALKDRYHKELQAMFEKKLSGARRWVWLGSAILGSVFTVQFGTLAVLAPTGFPWWGRLMFAGGALFGIGWAVLGIKILRRGSIDLKFDATMYNGMIWGFVVFMVTLSMVFAPQNAVGLRMIVMALVFLVMGAVFMIRHVVEQSELKTREKLLEIEYSLAELAERMKPERPLPPTVQG